MKHGRIVEAEFRPHLMLRNAHVQTVLSSVMRFRPELALKLERWELPDGDFVDLGWFARCKPGQPIAVLVHGLTGDFESKYLRATAARLKALGWGGVILQLRGAGGEPNRLPHAYHQGDTADLLALLQRLRREHPDSLVATVGWSLGSNIVLKAAGEMGGAHPADFVVGASVPFELAPCAIRMREGMSRMYQRRLLGNLKLMASRKAAAVALPAEVDLAATLAARDFFEFDDAWTAPLNGFADSQDYYERCQCGPYLKSIDRSTLIVHALDDPFMSRDIVPSETALSPAVRMELSEHGGHVGFVGTDKLGRASYWLEQRICSWLQEQVLQTTERETPNTAAA